MLSDSAHSAREDNVARTYGNRESCAACDPARAGCRWSLSLLTGALMVMPFVFSAYPFAAQTNGNATKQHFACNVGYTANECQIAATVLRKALARYPVDALGEWTWVLVRTVDWKQVLDAKEMNVNDPAFSNLTRRK